MKTLMIAGALSLIGSAAMADPTGLWHTEASDEGNYLVVEVKPCGANMCGVIVDAKNAAGESNASYEHLGRDIITGMAPDGANKWDDGEIWAPDDDKTYSANMELNGNVLAVEGCVLVFCRGQNWTRAN